MRGWVVVILALVLLALAPLSAMAGSGSGGGITLTYPDDMTECAPTFDFATTGVDASWDVQYDIFRVENNVLVKIGSGSTTGDLNVSFTPQPLSDGEEYVYTIQVTVFVPGQDKPTKVGGKWSVKCEKEPPPPPAGGEGCTPGYWKNHKEAWPTLAVKKFSDVFGASALSPDLTMIGATALNGGGLNALARHAAAAYASASSIDVDYDLTPEEVVTAFQKAVEPGGDIEGTKDMFEWYNEQGCPL